MSPHSSAQPSAEDRLGTLIERLLASAEGAAAAGDWTQARTFVDDVLTVDPENQRAAAVLQTIEAQSTALLGERALMSILFSDLVDSTPMAEQAEPETMRDVFRLYREQSEEAIGRFGGRIVKFLGDGIVATFGYPETHEDDARRAVLAGLDLVEAMHHSRAAVKQAHGVDLEVRVGIHTGLVVVADLGGTITVERDAIVGTAPNLAARLQSEAAPGMVVVSDVTKHIVEPYFDLRSLGLRSLKGITRSVEVFAVEGKRRGAHAAVAYPETATVGRDDVLAALRSEWEEEIAAAARRVKAAADAAGASEVPAAAEAETSAAVPPAVLIVGDAGIGKSRIVAELCRDALEGDGRLVELACLPYYTNRDLWPVEQMLERHLGLSDLDSKARLEALRSWTAVAGVDPETSTPLLAGIAGVDPADYTAPELDPAALRAATLATLGAVLSATPEGHARLIVAEDLHWADPSTLQLLAGLATNPPPGVMLVMTARPDFDAPWLPVTKRIALDHLDETETQQLIDALIGQGDLPIEVRRSIVERSDGVPLFIEELTRSAGESDDREPLPLRLQELLTARLKDPGVDLQLAQLAATIGTVFDESTLSELLDGAGEVHSRLEALVEAGVLDRMGSAAEPQYRFRHALLRDAAYETQVLDTRRRTHQRVATQLMGSNGDVALVAYHLDQAGAAPEAAGQYVQAAQAAQGRGAHIEATRMLSRALELLEATPDSQERNLTELGVRMLRAFSVSSMRGYAAPEVLADFQRSEELSQLLGEAPQVLPSLIGIWSYSLVHGDVPGAARVADRLLASVEDGSAAWFAPEVDACVGFQRFYEGDLTSARHHLQSAMDGYGRRSAEEMVSPFWPLPNDPVAVTAIGLACVATLQADSVDAAAWEERAVGRASEVPFPRGPFSLAFVAVYLAWLRSLVGDRVGAEAFGREVTEIGHRHGYAYWVALGSIYQGTTSLELEPFEQSMAALQAIGHEAFRASYLVELALRRAATGDSAGAMQAVADATETARVSGELVHLAEIGRVRARLLAQSDGESARSAAADELAGAFKLAVRQGAYLTALEACLDLAETNIDPTFDWRGGLRQTLVSVPESSSFPQVLAARKRLDDSS